jgi:hypothetical protein
MATYIFQKIAKEGKAAGVTPGTEEARDWFRDRASDVRNVNIKQLLTHEEARPNLYNKVTNIDVGRMFMFFYDPKHKETLPYYDRFPLIFIMEKYNDGFLGMNMHYLPPLLRARLMDRLYSIEKQDNVRKSKKLRSTYNLLNSAAKFQYFKPTVKRYLTSHVRSRMLYIPEEQWDIALFLPTERFRKKKKNSVWRESRQIIRRN